MTNNTSKNEKKGRVPAWTRTALGIVVAIILTFFVKNGGEQAEPVSSVNTTITENSVSIEEVINAPEETGATTAVESATVEDEKLSEKEQETYYFRSKKLLNQHYEKHGIDMGFADAKEYEAAASAVVNNPAALHKLEAEDGDDIYYVEETNEFVVVSTDGYLRTYFLPDSGKKYFDKQ